MNIWFYLIYLVVLAAVFALLEINIEGGEGWAKNLPTWRIKGTWLNKISGRVELTGYHTFLSLFVLVFLHLPFVFFGVWSWWLELRILGSFLLLTAAEDFLWFVFNPNFSLAKFFRHEVPWHKFWLGPFPAFYYLNLIIGGLLMYFSYLR
ncbi:MAG: hypothetical protein V1807_02815 [Patescibacteria group bacterium]